MVGGEGMTEALRDYLQERFRVVRSGYGASDLSIGMGAETASTVWLRKRLMADPELRRELLCTINSRHVLQPKLRYNVGDEARLASLADVQRVSGAVGAPRR
jgi:phenylacetate-CoA ligase